MISTISLLLGGEIVLFPYQATGAADLVDENSPIGTVVSRITMGGHSLVDPTSSVSLDRTTDFALAEIDSQIWIVTNRVFDYDDLTESRSYPLTITAKTSSDAATKKISMGILPKNDNDFRGSGFSQSLRENDTTHFSLTVLASQLSTALKIVPPLFTDPDEELANNRWSVVNVSKPMHGTLNIDSASAGIFTYDPDEKGNEFLGDSFSYYIKDFTTYDISTREIGPYWATFKTRNVNDEPVYAFNDTVSVVEGSTVTVTIGGEKTVVANDRDEDNAYDRNGDGVIDVDFPLSARLISPSVGVSGTITVNGDGTFSYVQTGGGAPEKFLVEISDGVFKDTSELIVLISLQNNNTPAFSSETLTVIQGSTVTAFASGIGSLMKFASDGDLPHDTLSFVQFQGATLTGTATIQADGTFSYTHNGERVFADSIPLSIKDASGKWVNSYVPVKIIPAALNSLAMTIVPLSGVLPTLASIVPAMTDSLSPFPAGTVGTICDIHLSRFVAELDLSVEISLYDVVGNKMLTSSFPSGNREGFSIARHESGDLVRLFWNGRNESERVVGGGTYLLQVIIRDGFNGESVTATALWGTKRPPIEGL